MRGLSSSVLSVAAMGLSSLTTYLTFFDASYTLTVANADVPIQVQSGSSSSGGKKSAYYRFFPKPSVILSNRGKLALVVSDVRLHRSTDVSSCKIADDDKGKRPFTARGESPPTPMVIEPETIRHMQLEFGLEPVNVNADEQGAFDIPTDKGLWCLGWTVFDPNGRRHEVVSKAFTLERAYSMKEGERYPDISMKKDFPKHALRLVSRSIL